ncbi:MAG: Methionine-tRNA ligase [Parcubacteria group bacterium GW2011_GWC2_45_7]|nr:MAG: Methionine-tRNA ligase [Parcubacteria group bacterium GW2011_GWC2_45_7]
MSANSKWWPADLHLVGKDIIKFHCAYWPAMLMSAGLPLPHTVFAHGFFTVDGQKMSKTIGNVVDPVKIAQKYGNDVLRYYLLREIPFGADGDFSETRLRERYNGELANGLGNLVARVLTMVERYVSSVIPDSGRGSMDSLFRGNDNYWGQYESYMQSLILDRALDTVWAYVSELDTLIDRTQPWVLAKKDDKTRLNEVLYILAENLRHIAWMLMPFMPDTTQKIFDQLGLGKSELARDWEETKKWGGLKPGTKIKRGESLFPRLT